MDSKNYSLVAFLAYLSIFHLQVALTQAVVKGGYWFPGSGLASSDIDSSLFTHLFCGFANLNTQTNQLSIPSGCSSFTQTVLQRNPSVKTLLSIGGGSSNSSDFNKMASQVSSRKAFIDSTISLARNNGFHGLDLDWEQETTSTETTNMATLLTEWRAAVNAESSRTGATPLLLSAALAYSPRINPSASFPAQVSVSFLLLEGPDNLKVRKKTKGGWTN